MKYDNFFPFCVDLAGVQHLAQLFFLLSMPLFLEMLIQSWD